MCCVYPIVLMAPPGLSQALQFSSLPLSFVVIIPSTDHDPLIDLVAAKEYLVRKATVPRGKCTHLGSRFTPTWIYFGGTLPHPYDPDDMMIMGYFDDDDDGTPAGKHKFLFGWQHRPSRDGTINNMWTPGNDTVVLWLQNDAGKELWPVSVSAARDVVYAFCNAVPVMPAVLTKK